MTEPETEPHPATDPASATRDPACAPALDLDEPWPLRPWGKGTRSPDEERFLAGPQSRWQEFARATRIYLEFIKGFRALHFVGPCVTVFGSARFGAGHRYYELAREMGRRLGQAGLTVLTGGGPGIMEAANRGAREVGARSVGCNIQLPHEQEPNAYLDKFVEFRYFFVRKVMLVKYSYAFVVLPGGFGTLDEIFETATLMQTGKILGFPVVAMGTDYWAPLRGFLRDRLLAEGAIDPVDLERVVLTDDLDEAMTTVLSSALLPEGLKGRIRRSRLLGER